MLRERLITAGVLIPPLLLVLYVGGYLIAGLAYLAVLAIIWEFLSFSAPLSQQALLQRLVTIGLLPTGYLIGGPAGAAGGGLIAVLILFVLEIFLIEGERHDPQFTHSLSASLVAFAYSGVLGTAMVAVALHPRGNVALFWLMMTVFLSDTGAYFGGKYFGGPLFSPRISPKKTQSGSLCGIVSGVLGSLLAGWIVGAIDIWPLLIFFGVVAAVLGQLGDLAESLLKRSYGVKDAGNILPGHGGILDRIDGVLFAAPLLFFGPFL